MDDAPTTRRRTAHRRLLPAAAAIASGGVGLFLAGHHPLWPVALTAIFAVWLVASARWPGLWLFALPAAMPVLNLSPWTGWLIFDEIDLLDLGALAGGFARRALAAADPRGSAFDPQATAAGGGNAVVPATLFVLALLGLSRGMADGGTAFDWFAGYADASNTLRVSKSLFYAAALLPLLCIELQRAPGVPIGRLARGMQTGLALVGLAVLWERVAYPGLLDFSARYRTVAAFWEMHVGGAAIDVYLAMAAPFAAWALVSAKSRRGWAAGAALALLTGHACLTTFSRGAYLGVMVPLALLGAAWWWRLRAPERGSRARLAAQYAAFACGSTVVLLAAFIALGYGGTALALVALLALLVAVRARQSMHWRRAAALALTLALLTEAVAVIGGGTFMRSRIEASDRDFGARLAHWRHGIGLLTGPSDWLVGIGAGRLPARYARDVPRGEFSGGAALVATSEGNVLRLSGPASVDDYAGLFSLSQRITLQGGGGYRAGLKVRTSKPTTIALDACEQHLLYPHRCQGTLVRVAPSAGTWQSIAVPLAGPELDRGQFYAPRLGMFSASVVDAGTAAEVAGITLTSRDGSELLANGDFSAGLARWFPTAESHFLPWHIDNLYLELLIEHGALGLAAALVLIGMALRNLRSQWLRGTRMAPFLAASIFGVLLVGCVSSVLDVPRIALTFLLIVVFSFSVEALPEIQARAERRLDANAGSV
jgi:O-antigen ligase